MTSKRILVVGAGGALGGAIVRSLLRDGHRVLATLRTRRPDIESVLKETGAELQRLDLQDDEVVQKALSEIDAAIFTPILSTSKTAAQFLKPGQRSVFFSSNNVEIDPDDAVYAELLGAEDVVRAVAPAATILRPTMIYGYPGDGNLSRLAAFMKRFPVAPMPGAGGALQQPVYYEDLAEVAAAVIFDETLAGKTRSIAGPEAISQRELYAAVGDAIGKRVMLAPLPVNAVAGLVKGSEGLGLRLPVKAAQLTRASLNKTPRSADAILTGTPLKAGLAEMVKAMGRPGGS